MGERVRYFDCAPAARPYIYRNHAVSGGRKTVNRDVTWSLVVHGGLCGACGLLYLKNVFLEF